MQSGVTSLFPAQNLKRPHQEDTWHPLPTRVSFAARSSSLAARQSPEEYPKVDLIVTENQLEHHLENAFPKFDRTFLSGCP